MQNRKNVIKTRATPENDVEGADEIRGVRPVDEDVLAGQNLEHKIIWQYLKSGVPVHCR